VPPPPSRRRRLASVGTPPPPRLRRLTPPPRKGREGWDFTGTQPPWSSESNRLRSGAAVAPDKIWPRIRRALIPLCQIPEGNRTDKSPNLENPRSIGISTEVKSRTRDNKAIRVFISSSIALSCPHTGLIRFGSLSYRATTQDDEQ
jgi:hypothetical protein